MRRFITYRPWHGDINNVRLHFESVAVLAYLLDRYIAIPEHLHRFADAPVANFPPIHPSVFLDLSKLPIVSLADVPASASWHEVEPFLPHEKFFFYENGPNIEAFSCGREAAYLPNTPDVINLPPMLSPFYTMIFSTVATRKRMTSFVQNYVRHYEKVELVARDIARELGAFHAVHVRRNDFIKQYPKTDIPIDVIASQLSYRVPPGSLLLVATDEPDRGFFGPLMDRYHVLFAGDVVRSAAPDWTHYQIACVEQNLCALANTFTGTRLSTFSAYINRLRGYNRVADTSFRFTDGLLHHTPSSVWFSWEAFIPDKEPLWGREFSEGWAV